MNDIFMRRFMIRQKLDTYLDLCTQVYDLNKPRPPEDAYAFYRSYLMEAKGAVLEPMCGTGRFFLPLLEEGFDVYDYDLRNNLVCVNAVSYGDSRNKVWTEIVHQSSASVLNLTGSHL